MNTLKELIDLVGEKLGGLYEERVPKELYSPIAYSLSVGGKRIRPALCLLACNLFTDDLSEALNPAIGLEVFHNFTLLHDDIMDKAPIRRNKPTVHMKWNENTAILSGDAMLIESYEYFFKLKPELLSKVLPVFNQTAREVCEGQQFDMNFESTLQVSEAEYMEMIRLKTAVLLAASLKIGAAIGGASDKEAQQFYDFGIAMGLGFQLQDDYLDTFGNEATFGKQIGGDILENKKTFLLIKSLEYSPEATKALLNKTDIKNQEKIEKVRQIYTENQIDKEIRSKILEYYQQAEQILSEINIADDKKFELQNLLTKLKQRVF